MSFLATCSRNAVREHVTLPAASWLIWSRSDQRPKFWKCQKICDSNPRVFPQRRSSKASARYFLAAFSHHTVKDFFPSWHMQCYMLTGGWFGVTATKDSSTTKFLEVSENLRFKSQSVTECVRCCQDARARRKREHAALTGGPLRHLQPRQRCKRNIPTDREITFHAKHAMMISQWHRKRLFIAYYTQTSLHNNSCISPALSPNFICASDKLINLNSLWIIWHGYDKFWENLVDLVSNSVTRWHKVITHRTIT